MPICSIQSCSFTGSFEASSIEFQILKKIIAEITYVPIDVRNMITADLKSRDKTPKLDSNLSCLVRIIQANAKKISLPW